MKELLMLKGVKTLVDVCTKVKPLEDVRIVTNITLGERIKAAVRYDRLMWDPKIDADDDTVLKGPKVLV